jgi:anti-sigma B factor antagonist
MTASASRLLLVSCPVHGCSGKVPTDLNRVWAEEQRCPECGGLFRVAPIDVPESGEATAPATLLRLPTYDQEHLEVRLEEAFVIELVGRLDLFASELLQKAWRSLPLPRRALLDLRRTTELSPKGVAALLELCTPTEEGRVVILLRTGDAEQRAAFADNAALYDDRNAALGGLGEVPEAARHLPAVAIRREEVAAQSPPKKDDPVAAAAAQARPQPIPRRRRLEVEEIGDVTVVNFVDKKILDEQNIATIRDQLFGLLDVDGRRKILLNFCNIEYLSSTALGVFFHFHKKVHQAGGRLLLCEVDRQIYEVFQITRTDRIFRVYKDEQSALQAF